jgi:PAS domain S-box-containing protein
MQVLPTTAGESRRLAALADLQILDTPTEALFDAFTRLAATICRTPISLMSLVDADRQWFKSNFGLPGVNQTPRAIAFCDHTIRQPSIFEISDARVDERFSDNPLVVDEPHLRFYAGVPLVVEGGQAVGTICVIDREVRQLTDWQREALIALAGTIVEQLQARRTLVLERDLAEERVNALSLALALTEDAVAIAALTSPDAPSKIIYANDAFLKLKGAKPEDIAGLSASKFYGERTDLATVKAMRAKVFAGEACRAEYISYRLDGTHYYASVAAHPIVDEAGVTTHMVTIQRDVTELIVRDAHLAIQNERLTALTAIARSIFAALDPRALVDALTVGARELVGAEARLLIALPSGGFGPTADLVPPEDGTPIADPLLDAAEASTVPILADDERRAVVRIPGPADETRYLLDLHTDEKLATVDVFAIGLLAQYFAVAARNVELYGELQTRRAAVVELNQVKNDLIAMLAHDFKGPLTTIVGFADVLAEDDRFDDESRKFLAMISSSAMRLASLATDTLALSRLEQNELTLNIEEFDLVALVTDIVRVFSVTRRIDFASEQKRLIIGGDPARLRQVFENLIGNAIKYSPNGEPVRVTMRAVGKSIECSVIDRGIGIPEADMPKLFGRFARAQNARTLGIGGTGFGLYLTKTILEMHGGAIDVRSREGEGSTFRAHVPVSAAASRPQHRRFLLIDPAGDARSYMAHTLRDEGYAATVVDDGEAALAQIDEVEFDAALVDTERVGMPLDEFVRRVAERTALVRIDSVKVEESAGWVGYLVKPFLHKDLLATLETAMARHPRRKPETPVSFTDSAITT